MAETNTYFDKAISNFNNARIVRQYMSGDESQLNIIAYHLQQSLEFCFKYLLEINGVEYPKTHDIEQLALIAKSNNVDLKLTEYIEEHCEMFSQWEAKARYILGYTVEAKKVDRAILELDHYFAELTKK